MFGKDDLFGSRPYQAHLSAQYVPELGKFIQAEPPEQATHPGYSLVIWLRLGAAGLRTSMHCAELVNAKHAFVFSEPILQKQKRTRRVQHDHQTNRDCEKAGDSQPNARGNSSQV